MKTAVLPEDQITRSLWNTVMKVIGQWNENIRKLDPDLPRGGGT